MVMLAVSPIEFSFTTAFVLLRIRLLELFILHPNPFLQHTTNASTLAERFHNVILIEIDDPK